MSTFTTPSDLLATALEAAAAAARVAYGRRYAQGAVRVKGFRDIVTETDVAAQAAATAVIAARFPAHAILGEESRPETHAPALAAETVWVIDPIDGTTNFSRGFPVFSVSIGVLHQGEPVAGVIVDPLRRHTFYAARGQGAFLEDGDEDEPRPLAVSGVDQMADAIGGFDWAREPAARRQVIEYLARLAPACRTVRAMGSAALGVVYVAAGWLDVYYHLLLAPWDAVAGVAIVREAGGRVTELPAAPGGPAPEWDLMRPRLLATNGVLHKAAQKVLLGEE